MENNDKFANAKNQTDNDNCIQKVALRVAGLRAVGFRTMIFQTIFTAEVGAGAELGLEMVGWSRSEVRVGFRAVAELVLELGL